jgi:hypothetical protein
LQYDHGHPSQGIATETYHWIFSLVLYTFDISSINLNTPLNWTKTFRPMGCST